MPKLAPFKRIFKGDFDKQYDGLMETLGFILNRSLEALYQALSNDLTLTDNVKCTVKDVLVSVNSNGIPLVETRMDLTIQGKIRLVQVGGQKNQTNPTTYPTSGVSITWTQSGKSIIFNHITGLQANDVYRLNVVAYGE